MRRKNPVLTLENVNKYQVTAVTFNDTAEQIVSGGIDNALKVKKNFSFINHGSWGFHFYYLEKDEIFSQIWDIRRQGLIHLMPGHSDTVTGINLSPDGNHVVSNSMDCTVINIAILCFVI